MQHFDMVGVGFGPANLALALALHEQQNGAGPSHVFFDRQSKFGWHTGMLIDDATMQISFLKDLVTQRDPCSRHSFVNFLKEKGRLQDFINLKTFYPTRTEFHDYLAWCAEAVRQRVKYGSEIVGISCGPRTGTAVRSLTLTVKSPDQERPAPPISATAVVLAQGIRPRMPAGVACGERIWHSADFVHRLQRLRSKVNTRFVVVGSGQSAAEVVGHLYARDPTANIHAVLSKFAYTPADDSPFVNRLFDPEAVDEFFHAEASIKERILSEHANTNYGVVDGELISSLYRAWYQDRCLGRNRLHFEKFNQLASAIEGEEEVRVSLKSGTHAAERVIHADYLICATGYDSVSPEALLSGELRAMLVRDKDGRPMISRSYRLETTSDLQCPIFVQGAVEASHGLSATLISNLAVRAGEIATAIDRRIPKEDELML